jgi:putative phage-type endonuclease
MKIFNNIIQGSDEWFQFKKGKVGGTFLKSIMGTPKAFEDACYELLGEKLISGVEEDSSYENAMDRGTRLESEAIAAYQFETGRTVTKTGACLSDENSSVMYSPDGLEGETEDVEIKCPLTKNYMKIWIKIDFKTWTFKINNEIPDEYYWQIIQAFIVNPKLQRRNFVAYNPNFKQHPLHIIVVERDSVLVDIEKAKKKQFETLEGINKLMSQMVKL